MKFTDVDQLKAYRYLNNLEVVEKSLQQEFEVGRIDDMQLASMLRGIAEQRRNLYKVIEAMSEGQADIKRAESYHFLPPKKN